MFQKATYFIIENAGTQKKLKKEKIMKSNEFYVWVYKHPVDIAYIFQLTSTLCGSKKKT